GLDLGLAHPLRCQMLLKRVAAFRRVAEAEGALRGDGKAALAQIGARPRPFRRLQLLLEEPRRELHHLMQGRARLLPLLLLRVARRHRHAGQAGDALHRLGEAHPVELGEEAEMVARHAAAEAVVAALAVLAVEGGGLLAVEGAAGPPIAARGVGLFAIPCDALADHRRNRDAVTYLVQE